MSTASAILRVFTAHWTSAIVASAVELGVFEHLERGSRTIDDLSRSLPLPPRSVQCLLDALVTEGFVSTQDGISYENSPATSTNLIRGKAEYLGGFAQIVLGPSDGGMRQWSQLPTALRQGKPIAPESLMDPESPFWPELVTALLPLSREVATIAAELMKLAEHPSHSILDIGGGAGAYASVWLERSPTSHLTQIDWQPVNALARRTLDARGLGSRFTTVNGDYRSLPFAAKQYDIVVLSNILHHESPEENLALLRKVAPALIPGGQLLISDFVLHDDRTGPSFAAHFGLGMILQTPRGSNYRERDYQAWLEEAGFKRARVDRSHPLSTLLIAQIVD